MESRGHGPAECDLQGLCGLYEGVAISSDALPSLLPLSPLAFSLLHTFSILGSHHSFPAIRQSSCELAGSDDKTQVYPEVKDAVDKAIGAVVRTRPPDPFVFIAQKLREVCAAVPLLPSLPPLCSIRR